MSNQTQTIRFQPRNAIERANNHPSRGGTTRRVNGNKIPGEFNEYGQPIGDPTKHNQPMSKGHDWSYFEKSFGGVKAAPSGEESFKEVQGPTKSGEPLSHGVRSGDNDASEAPAIGSTRKTAFGTETLMESKGGARWVGSVSNAPAPNNFRPGQAAAASMPERQVVHMKPFAPLGKRGEMDAATEKRNLARNMDLAKSPVDRGLDDAHKDSRAMQAELDQANPANQRASAAIANFKKPEGRGMTPFGPVAKTSASLTQQLAKKAPAAGRNGSMPSKATHGATAQTPAAPVRSSAPAAPPGVKTPNPFLPAVPAAPRVPATTGVRNSPQERAAREAARRTAEAQKQTQIKGAVDRAYAKARAQTEAMPKTAFGQATVPLKPARLVTPKRPDKVNKAAYN